MSDTPFASPDDLSAQANDASAPAAVATEPVPVEAAPKPDAVGAFTLRLSRRRVPDRLCSHRHSPAGQVVQFASLQSGHMICTFATLTRLVVVIRDGLALCKWSASVIYNIIGS